MSRNSIRIVKWWPAFAGQLTHFQREPMLRTCIGEVWFAMLHLRFAVLTALVATTAIAQEPPSVVAYYQQYSAALENGDLAAAERAAASALAVSEQRDGMGGRTPILALNLARTRVQLGQWQDASAPARLAYDLSRTNSASGVDQGMAGLLWARVRLANEGFQASGFVSEMLDRSEDRADLLGDRYDAAEQLGVWAMQTRNFLIARSAWAHAADTAQGAPYDAAFARGRALAHEGMAITMQSIARDDFRLTTLPRQALQRLSAAHALIRPFVFADSPSEPSRAAPDSRAAQVLYAQILAWDAAIWSQLDSETPPRYFGERLEATPRNIDGIAVCAIRRESGSNRIDGSFQTLGGDQLSAAVAGLHFDSMGVYQGADLMATVGNEGFVRAAAVTASTWTYVAELSGDCRPAALYFVPIAFLLHD